MTLCSNALLVLVLSCLFMAVPCMWAGFLGFSISSGKGSQSHLQQMSKQYCSRYGKPAQTWPYLLLHCLDICSSWVEILCTLWRRAHVNEMSLMEDHMSINTVVLVHCETCSSTCGAHKQVFEVAAGHRSCLDMITTTPDQLAPATCCYAESAWFDIAPFLDNATRVLGVLVSQLIVVVKPQSASLHTTF